jgi:hypothetical protein
MIYSINKINFMLKFIKLMKKVQQFPNYFANLLCTNKQGILMKT